MIFHRTIRWLVTGAYVLVVSWLSLTPVRILPQSGPLAFRHIDKVAHFGMYFGLALLLCWALEDRFPGKRLRTVVWSALLAEACGTAMEVGQLVIKASGHYFSVGDLIANSGGALGGVLAYVLGCRLVEAYRTRGMVTAAKGDC